MRLIQHKREAFYFYRFLSVFYDDLVNPLFWTERMRDEALQDAVLDRADLEVVDVGSGTGFTTEGIVKNVNATNVICLDQSPEQMRKARKKTDLQDCSFVLGDAENLPFDTNRFDRYVSAGSIEYWPEPQRGVNEAFRVLKPGGIALLVGPLKPANPFSRFLAEMWMLFPEEEEYIRWFEGAGFRDIKIRYVQPHWHRGKGKYGIAISGLKPEEAEFVAREEPPIPERNYQWIKGLRLFAGALAGFLFIPIALFAALLSIGRQRDIPVERRERLNGCQISAIAFVLLFIFLLIWLLI